VKLSELYSSKGEAVSPEKAPKPPKAPPPLDEETLSGVGGTPPPVESPFFASTPTRGRAERAVMELRTRLQVMSADLAKSEEEKNAAKASLARYQTLEP